MPARMWRHGIHSFLELLRHRVPDLLDHMLAFVYLAYSMLTLEMESAPPLEETWIESLGNLARYSIAVAEADLRDREVWLRVSRMWYRMAVDQKLDTRSIPPPLAVLVRLDGELLESKQDLRRRNTSSNDNVDQHCSTPRVRVENIVTHPSASDENDANCTRAHSTEYFKQGSSHLATGQAMCPQRAGENRTDSSRQIERRIKRQRENCCCSLRCQNSCTKRTQNMSRN